MAVFSSASSFAFSASRSFIFFSSDEYFERHAK
jgi:hypothetical protein